VLKKLIIDVIAMTLIFRHFFIMPQKFGVNSRNDDFGDILYKKTIRFL